LTDENKSLTLTNKQKELELNSLKQEKTKNENNDIELLKKTMKVIISKFGKNMKTTQQSILEGLLGKSKAEVLIVYNTMLESFNKTKESNYVDFVKIEEKNKELERVATEYSEKINKNDVEKLSTESVLEKK